MYGISVRGTFSSVLGIPAETSLLYKLLIGLKLLILSLIKPYLHLTTSRHMSNLTNLPSEVWEQILGYNSDSCVITLLKCGSTLLSARVRSVNRCEVHLEDQNPVSTSRFPKELLSLRFLRELHLTRPCGYLMPTQELSLALKSLSSCLEALLMNCQEAQMCFFDSPSDLPADCLDFSQHSLWDVATTWPNLRVLSLQSTSEEDPAFAEHHIAQLPRSLVELRLSSVSVLDSSALGQALPPNLTAFEVFPNEGSRKLRPLDLAHLSKLLEWEGCTIFEDNIEHLPSSVTFAPVLLSFCDDIPPLPPKLRTLRIDCLTVDSEDLLADTFASLPRCLDTFRCEFSPFSLSAAAIKALPTTLTHLHWSSDVDWDDIEAASNGASIWPPLLQTLQILSESAYSTLTLPNTLTHLGDVDLDLGQMDDTHEVVALLPRTLRSFTGRISMNYEFGDVPPLKFPHNVTNLSINLWRSNWIASLPRQLEKFKTAQLEGKTDELLRDLQRLPDSLRSVTIEWTSMRLTQSTDTPFSHLHNLTHLHVGSCARFDPHFIRFLSRKLNWLSVDLIRFDLNDAKYLPPNLQHANFLLPLGKEFIEFWPERCSYSHGSLFEAIEERNQLLESRAKVFPDPRISAKFQV